MKLDDIRKQFEFGRATNEVMLTYDFAIKLLAVAEAVEEEVFADGDHAEMWPLVTAAFRALETDP